MHHFSIFSPAHTAQHTPSSPRAGMVPMVIEREGNGERSFDIFSAVMRNRIVFIKEGFNSAMASIVSAQLMFLAKEDSQTPIELHINSPGGEVYALLDIITTIEKIKVPIYTFATGLVASCGSLLFQMGEQGHRYMGRFSRQMIHQPSSGAQGTVTDMKISIDESERLKRDMYHLYAERNSKGLSYQEIFDLCERDRWLSAQESIDLGFADHII